MNVTKQIKCFKYLVFTYIILLMIIAAIEIIYGSFLLYGHIGYGLVLKNNVWAPSTLLICTGPVTLILCWLGFNAISKKNQCKLGLFSGCLVIIICLLLFICGWCLFMRHKLSKLIVEPVTVSFHQYAILTINEIDPTLLWNRIQSNLECCGVHGYSDYKKLAGSTPNSCFSKKSPTLIIENGCLEKLLAEAEDGLLKCCLSAAAFALLMCTGVFCAVQLTVLLKKQPKREQLPTVTLRVKNQQELSPLSKNRSLKQTDELKKIKSSTK